MSELIKLSKEIVDQLAIARNDGFSNYALIGMLYDASRHKAYKPIQIIDSYLGQGDGKMHPDDLLQALVNGYEVELTGEQKVEKYFKSLAYHRAGETSETISSKLTEREAVINTLNYLNIRIIGVNIVDTNQH